MDGHTLISRRCKSPRFCLTLVGEARVWYESLRPINEDGKAYKINLDNSIKDRKQKRTIVSCMVIISFWWKYRNIRFIHDTYQTSSYTSRLWGATIFEVFKNKLPTKLFWVLFSIEDLIQAVETAKIILTKGKDR